MKQLFMLINSGLWYTNNGESIEHLHVNHLIETFKKFESDIKEEDGGYWNVYIDYTNDRLVMSREQIPVEIPETLVDVTEKTKEEKPIESEEEFSLD